MKTPIRDFVQGYSDRLPLRLHMPGHKGKGPLGFEDFDITEIGGADSLYEAEGIIAESEKNACELFGCDTYYSTEGSSQCIRAMLHLAAMHAGKIGKRPHIAAFRNVHKTFLSAAALIDFDITWLYPDSMDSYLSCSISIEKLKYFIEKYSERVTALYITSPDYLGNIENLRGIAEICHKNNVLLLVDNAHGAYLKFLPESLHPMDFGADLCCDSAHKTLPVLTGGAYLHVSDRIADIADGNVKNILSLYGSTSPSYLILQSLDEANKYISNGYKEKLKNFCGEISARKQKLAEHGYIFCGNEPLKLTLKTKEYGYYGYELSDILERSGICCEFSDPDFLVMMFTPEIGVHGLDMITEKLLSITKKSKITEEPPKIEKSAMVTSIREASFSQCETVDAENSLGRILASPSVGCPPAVPILVCGERISKNAVDLFKYYGIRKISVLK